MGDQVANAVFCPACEAVNFPNAVYCVRCKQKLPGPLQEAASPAYIYCPTCRGGNWLNAAHCQWCGTYLTATPAALTAPFQMPRGWGVWGRGTRIAVVLAVLFVLVGVTYGVAQRIIVGGTFGKQFAAGTPQRVVADALDNADRSNLARSISFSGDTVTIRFRMEDNLTTGLMRVGAEKTVFSILESLAHASIQYGTVVMTGSANMVDRYGNAHDQTVVRLSYSKDTLARINWRTIDRSYIFGLADSAEIHPEFR